MRSARRWSTKNSGGANLPGQSCYHARFATDNPELKRRVPIDLIRSRIADEMAVVDRVIRSSLHSEVVLVGQVAEHIIAGGGKRLRPALVILASQAFGYRGSAHYQLAAILEFIHTATLLHDDVVDDSAMRRGQATANARFGNSASVLVGDFVYSRAFQMMVEIGSMRVMEVLAEATNVIAEGEVMQLMNCRNADVDEADYLRIIRCKTAKLFEAAARLGAVVSGAPRDDEDAMARYGMHLGTAFQLVDDVLDYSGDLADMGKNLGDDLAEGKTTLPLIVAMRDGTPSQASLVRQAIEGGGLSEMEGVLAAIRGTGALDYARRQAHAEAQAARDALAGLPHSAQRDCLLELATFAVTRRY